MIIEKEYAKIRLAMRMTIDAEKKSKPENEEIHPKVGAALLKNNEIIGVAFRGQYGPGDHAEYTLFEKVLKDIDCTDGILFTTLEPCTTRKTKKTCCDWILEKGIKQVYIGMYDPNSLIFGTGYSYLKSHGIDVYDYPPEFKKEIEDDNFQFIQFCKLANTSELKSLEDLPYHLSPHYRSLDDWYHIINRIYFDKNFAKDDKLIFTHLVEILGGLSVLYTNKQKSINAEEQLAKALAWWFVLCGKMGIRSVEEMVYNKFPNVCPYCQKKPHNEDLCIHIKANNPHPSWSDLSELSRNDYHNKPRTIASWQQMFYSIYPITQNDDYDKVLGRFTEEIGELAEAIRVFKVAPTYFLSEAADVFAWLMHLNNLYETRVRPGIVSKERGLFIEDILFGLYPDKCKDCNQQICNCPPVLKSTIGRISNDGPSLELFDAYNNPFMTKAELAKQFDSGCSIIRIGNYQFDTSSYLIKNLYYISTTLPNLIRYINNKDDATQFGRIIDDLHIINSYSCTQRVNQFSINRFLKHSIDLHEIGKNTLIEILMKLENIDEELKKAIISVIEVKVTETIPIP